MEVTDLNHDERLRWLKFVLKPSSPCPKIHDWESLFNFADNQAIIGVCEPTRFNIFRPDIDVFFEWIGVVEQLRGLNTYLNKQVVQLFHKLKEDGLRCCILKGQGNAAMYPDAGLRSPGDIDVWVDADRETVLEYVKKVTPNVRENFKHIKLPLFENTEVDLHFTPLKLYHPIHNKRLQQWIQENKEQQMAHSFRLPNTDTDIAIPTAEFNAVYQMGHIMVHVEDEGIGLRQMVDYFYVLRALGEIVPEQKETIRKAWTMFGMMKLAGAVMWIEHFVLGLPEEFLLTDPNEKRGRLLLADIFEGGNFGFYSRRQGLWKYGRIAKKSADAWHLIRISSLFPCEVFFRLIAKFMTACNDFFKTKIRNKN